MNERFVKWMKATQKRVLNDDWDHIDVVSGPRRSGKSTLALAKALVWDKNFSLDAQMAFTADEYIRKADDLARGKPIILDEPVSGLLSGDTTTATSKELYKAITIAGERNLIHQFIIPSIKRLTGPLREDYIEWNQHVVGRGVFQHRRLADLEHDKVFAMPQVMLHSVDFPDIPARLRTEYRKRKRAFTASFMQGQDHDVVASMAAEIRPRIRSVMKRHGLST